MSSLWFSWDAFKAYLDSPVGMITVSITMAVSFVLFPPKLLIQNVMDEESKGEDLFLRYKPYQPTATWLSDFKVLKAMWFCKITGSDLQERLNNFYERQADLYDGYRVRMLHGRPRMLHAIAEYYNERFQSLTKTQKKKIRLVWVDLACGTGYNLESFSTSLDAFSSIYLLDLCVPLTKVAQRDRADKYNNKNSPSPKIKVILGDATDFDNQELPAAGTVDLVTISYSLVMIPDWKKALANAQRLLKPGGLIAVCDFTLDPGQYDVTKKFWKQTFESDHVFLDEAHLQTLYKQFDVVKAEGSYGPLPYTPVFLQPAYYYFLGTTKPQTKEEPKKDK